MGEKKGASQVCWEEARIKGREGFRFRELPLGRSLQCWIHGFSFFH